jgi:hypothetical protein
VKRPSPHPTLQFSLGLTRLRERRFRCNRNERVEPGIERFNARDAGLRQLNWRYFLLSHQCRGLVQLEVGEVISRGDRGGIQHRCADRERRVACAEGHACCADQRFLEKDSSRARRMEGRIEVWFERYSHVTSSHSRNAPRSEQAVVNGPQQLSADPGEVLDHAVNQTRSTADGSPTSSRACRIRVCTLSITASCNPLQNRAYGA